MQRLRKGDEVIVLSGDSKGARGKIDRVIYDAARQVSHVVILGVNTRKKHSRGNPQRNEPGGIISIEHPLPECKVALFNEAKSGPDRVRIVVSDDGKRERVYASSGEKF